MPIHCPNCDHALDDEELPRLSDSARVLCPQCQEPLTLPDFTIPMSLEAPGLPTAKGGLDPSKKYALLVISGKEPGKVFDIEKSMVTIGRSDCDVLLEDPEISRRHAKLEIDGASATLSDLGSTNGIFLGERQVQRVSIGNRARVRIGSHELAFVVADRDS